MCRVSFFMYFFLFFSKEDRWTYTFSRSLRSLIALKFSLSHVLSLSQGISGSEDADQSQDADRYVPSHAPSSIQPVPALALVCLCFASYLPIVRDLRRDLCVQHEIWLCAMRTGKEIEFDIEPTDTVKRIKERVEEKEGIPPPQQV